jgi:hypothetical protein
MTAVPGGVWDYVPADPTWPYVCLESAEERPNDSIGAQGRTVDLTFAIFSSYQGRTEQMSILDSLVRVLRYTRLTMTGWDHLMTDYTGGRAISPFDVGNTRAGALQASFDVEVVEA